MMARPGPIPGRPDAPVTAGRRHGIPSLRDRTLLPDPSGRIADRPGGPAMAASPVLIPSLTRPVRTGPLRARPSTRLSQAHSRTVPTRAAGTWAGVRRAAGTPLGRPEPDDRGRRTLAPSPVTGPAGPPAGPPLSPMAGPGTTRAPAIGVSVTQVPASRARSIRSGVYQTPMSGTCAPRPSGRPGWPRPRSLDWDHARTEQIGPEQIEPRPQGSRPQGSRRASRGRRRRSSAAGPSWRWGGLSGGRGTLIVLAAAVLGTGVTVGMHHDPGYLLGGAVIAGTFVAALAVRREAVHQLIPVPALAYLVGALTAGLMHEQSAAPSRAGLAVSATQWVAGGFVTMAAATAVAAAITVIRWLMNRHAAASGTPARPEPLAADQLTSRSGSFSGPGRIRGSRPGPGHCRSPGPRHAPNRPSGPGRRSPRPAAGGRRGVSLRRRRTHIRGAGQHRGRNLLRGPVRRPLARRTT